MCLNRSVSIIGVVLAEIPHTWQEHNQLPHLETLRSTPAISEAMLQKIRESKPSFEVGMNEMFEGMSLHDAQQLMGVLKNPKPSQLPVKIQDPMDLPTDFDARTKWPQCASINEIRDQANCGRLYIYVLGFLHHLSFVYVVRAHKMNCASSVPITIHPKYSCWAFGSVEALTDRFCIASNGTKTPHLSAQDLTSCNIIEDHGCNGGIPELAWGYMKLNGVVTGGNYGDKSMCYSYQLAPCAHHINGSKYPACPDEVPTPTCARKCIDDGAAWEGDKHHAATAYSVCGNETTANSEGACAEAMAQEIFANGPITAMFFVHQSFLAYKSGVYHHNLFNDPMLV